MQALEWKRAVNRQSTVSLNTEDKFLLGVQLVDMTFTNRSYGTKLYPALPT